MTNTQLSKSAESVQQALLQKGLAIVVVELSSSTRTANEAAATIGCEIAQIVKSLLFRTKHTNQPVLVLASGINRVSEKAVEKLVGEHIVKADADFTREVTGFAIGGVPPVGHKQSIQHIFIDEELMHYKNVWAAAGTPHAVFTLPSGDIERITGGKVVSVKEEQ